MDIELDNKKPANIWLASYIADLLEVNKAMSKELEVESNGKSFKIPSMTSQIITPESSKKPVNKTYNDYIIIGLERNDEEDLPYKKHETMSLRIYTHRQGPANKIIRILREDIGDSDATCSDLALYQQEQGKFDYNFLSMRYRLLTGPEQLNLGTEGGLYASLVLLDYSYTYNLDKYDV